MDGVAPTTDEPQQIGRFDFTVRLGEPSAQAKARWEERVEALAAWLLAEWHREQQRRMAERN